MLGPVLLCFLVLVSLLAPLAVSARTLSPLTGPPVGERWFGIYFNDERTGFAHLKIHETPEGYLVESDSSVKMSGFGFSREASARERYQVNRDLSLRSFEVSQTIDGSPMNLTGQVGEKALSVTTETKGNRRVKTLPLKGRVYPPAVLNLYPLMQKVTAGKKFRVTMFDPEAVALKEVRITALGFETLDGQEVLHLRNNLYPFVDNDIWVDFSGNTLRESVRDGWIETKVERADDARVFLAEAALSKKDLLLDFGRVPLDKPLEQPATLRSLTVELTGFAENLPLISDSVQKSERLEGTLVRFTVDVGTPPAACTPSAVESPVPQNYLEATDRILTDNPGIVQRKNEILAATKDPRQMVEKLVSWVAENITESSTDSQSPLETLEKRTGSCQSHARLYLSLARAAGLPTRFVSGLVYVEGKGFLYHSWAESYVGYWLPVDPTFGEVPANATHIKLAEGDAPGDLAPLAVLVGVIRARVVAVNY
ncbi:MAG: transglutaminase domain-containing protein [Deltaproteobacteria bacterium]|nr:transglutaminase domain-containing protein [Deltaproteobacteria bacterium]TLN00813.1 MAG: transglutaminase domain-containing protein [bacterium]